MKVFRRIEKNFKKGIEGIVLLSFGENILNFVGMNRNLKEFWRIEDFKKGIKEGIFWIINRNSKEFGKLVRILRK